MNVFKITIAAIFFFISGCSAADPPEWHMVNVNAQGPQGDAHLLIDNGVVSLVGYWASSAKLNLV